MTRITLVLPIALFATLANAQGVLLIPSSSTGAQKVMSFSPVDGSLINANFIVSGQNGAPTMTTPKNIIDSGRGTLFLSDQVANAVWEFDYSGNFLGTVASAAQGLSNIRGIAVSGGSLYVTVGGGPFINTIQKFDLTNANAQSTFISTNLNSPFDIYFRSSDVLVSNSSGSSLIGRFDKSSGAYLGDFASQSTSAMRFPQQINPDTANSNLLVAGFSVPAGLYSFDQSGAQQSTVYCSGLGLRGAYRLQNGNILYTISTKVAVWDPVANVNLSDSLVGPNAQYVELVAVPEPATLATLGLAALLAIRRKPRG